LTHTCPAFGRSIPITSFMQVDFPDPFGPISPRISPGSIEKAMSRTATRPP
jgi:hypothetical protein